MPALPWRGNHQLVPVPLGSQRLKGRVPLLLSDGSREAVRRGGKEGREVSRTRVWLVEGTALRG